MSIVLGGRGGGKGRGGAVAGDNQGSLGEEEEGGDGLHLRCHCELFGMSRSCTIVSGYFERKGVYFSCVWIRTDLVRRLLMALIFRSLAEGV